MIKTKTYREFIGYGNIISLGLGCIKVELVDTHSRLVSLEDQLCLNQDEAKEVIHIKGEMSKTLEDHSLTIDSQDDDLYKKDGQPSLA